MDFSSAFIQVFLSPSSKFSGISYSYQRSYRVLLEGMTNNDLALEANFGDFQLLVFPSNLLPLRSQCKNHIDVSGYFIQKS